MWGRHGFACDSARGRRRGGVAWWLALAITVGACARAAKRPPPSLTDIDTGVQGDPRAVMQKEVIAEMLDGYIRDEPPEHGLSMLGTVDAARIGVGPGDVLVGAELDRAPSRWPLLVTEGVMARSKAPLAQLSADASAAWVADEISWRVTLCDRVSVVPLRYTALYGRDADRWVLVVEHLSYGNEPSAEPDGAPRGRTISGATISRGLADALSRELAPLWQGATPPHLDTSAAAIALGPRWSEERRGRAVAGWTLQDQPLQVESRRIGVVGRDVERATVAYWIGTVVRKTAGQTQRLRATFVFERHGAQWTLMQSHVSVPIDDESLAVRRFGTAVSRVRPLALTCDQVPVAPAVK